MIGWLLLADAAHAVTLAPHHADRAACAAQSDAGLTGAWAQWRGEASPIDAARDAAGTRRARIVPGRPYRMRLHPQAAVAVVGAAGEGAEVERPHAGLAAIRITRPGTYAIGLDGSGWVDFVQGGKLVEETGHGRPAQCSTLRKAVEFPLRAGEYLVQIVANPATKARVMVARVGQ